MPFFQPGDVREPTNDDFEYFKSMILDNSQWKKHHSKKRIQVFSRSTEVSSFKMIKVTASLSNVSAGVIYDTLHDSHYRASWDKTMKEGYEICQVSPTSVIDYHAIKAPFAFSDRDFVMNRVWRVCGDEYIIFNHSVFHKKAPPKKDCIRGICFLTGYLIIGTGPNSCDFYYLTQNDPRGIIPAWAINLGTKSLAPNIMKSLHRAALKYPAWKEQHDPDFKPWRFPNQQFGLSPPVDMNDILTEPDFARKEIDESHVSEANAMKECADDQTNDSGDDLLNDE